MSVNPNPNSPRQSTFSVFGGGAVTWDDNTTLFDGYMLVGLAYPLDTNSLQWPSINKGSGSFPRQRLPQWARIPIRAGVFDQNSRLWFNSDIDPPNTQYYAWFYGSDNKQLAGPTNAFQINSSNTTITVPTLTRPTLNTTPPTPQSYPGD